MARILHVDDDHRFLQIVKLMLERAGHIVEIAADGQKGLALAAERQPELIILDAMMPNLTGYDVLQRLRQDPRTARTRIIVLTARGQLMDKALALNSGANAFLTKPVVAEDLVACVQAVLDAGADARLQTGTFNLPVASPEPALQQVAPARPNGLNDPSPAASPPRIPVVPPVAPLRSRRLLLGAEAVAHPADVAPARQPIITLIGLRGGTGTTTLAINLAAALHAQHKRGTVLFDLTEVGGHAALHLHAKPVASWAALTALGDAPDPHAVRQLVVAHECSGVSLLSAPPLALGKSLSPAAVQTILSELAGMHNEVVVDAMSLNDGVIGALHLSAAVLIVMTDDLMSVQSTCQLLAALNQLAIDPARVRVVLNHMRPVFDIPAESLQNALKMPLAANIPYEPNQISALRRGVPLVNSHPESAFSQAVQQVARLLTTSE